MAEVRLKKASYATKGKRFAVASQWSRTHTTGSGPSAIVEHELPAFRTEVLKGTLVVTLGRVEVIEFGSPLTVAQWRTQGAEGSFTPVVRWDGQELIHQSVSRRLPPEGGRGRLTSLANALVA